MYTPLSVAVRFIAYSFLLFGVAEIIKLDALYPMEDGYYGEISFTEFSQEILLFAVFILYMVAGLKLRILQPVTNILSLVFLASFIREFNFIIPFWIYMVLPVLLIILWLLIRDYKKIKPAAAVFFSMPASAWFFSGFLLTYIFSRLMGRSSFWLILYDESNYRLAKAAVEEGIELAGDAILLISAIELLLSIRQRIRKEQE